MASKANSKDCEDAESKTNDTKILDVRPKLLNVDPILDAIFIYCTEIEIIHIHDTISAKENKKYWQSVPVIVFFDMTSSLTADILDKCCDILEILKENITTIAIRMQFDLFMNHIDYNQVSPFFNKILNCAEKYSLWRLRLMIKYKHGHSDFKWHELMHELIVSYMILKINKTNKFRKTITLRLAIRAIDFILFWKLNNDSYKHFLDNLKSSTCIGQLQLEFASLYKIHTNYSYMISNLFDAICSNISISGLGLKICADDSDNNNGGGFTQTDEDLTSLLRNNYTNDRDQSIKQKKNDEYMSYIDDCFKNKKIDGKYGGNNACWKKHSHYKFSSSEKDFSLRINSKYGIKNVLNAIQKNDDLCLNCLVLENVIYDHEENEQNWDDPFNNTDDIKNDNDNNDDDNDDMDKHNVWKELLKICTSDAHFVEILEFAESKIGKTYCEDLQKFFNTIIHGNKYNEKNKLCHIRKLELNSISQHGTDVFVKYMIDLMKNGLSYNPMLAEIKVKFDYIGNYQIFKTKFTKLINAGLFRINAMIESQFGIEQYLKDEMGFSFGIIQLILQLSRFQKIKFEINEGKNRFITDNAAQRVRFAKLAIMTNMIEQLKKFDDKYKERNMNKYLMWQYKDTLDDDKKPKYKPMVNDNNDFDTFNNFNELMSKYMKLICAGDVYLEIGFNSTK